MDCEPLRSVKLAGFVMAAAGKEGTGWAWRRSDRWPLPVASEDVDGDPGLQAEEFDPGSPCCQHRSWSCMV